MNYVKLGLKPIHVNSVKLTIHVNSVKLSLRNIHVVSVKLLNLYSSQVNSVKLSLHSELDKIHVPLYTDEFCQAQSPLYTHEFGHA